MLKRHFSCILIFKVGTYFRVLHSWVNSRVVSVLLTLLKLVGIYLGHFDLQSSSRELLFLTGRTGEVTYLIRYSNK